MPLNFNDKDKKTVSKSIDKSEEKRDDFFSAGAFILL